jgi:hypothetical protein
LAEKVKDVHVVPAAGETLALAEIVHVPVVAEIEPEGELSTLQLLNWVTR